MDLLVFAFSLSKIAICSLEESTGLAIRFMIGKTKNEEKMAELRREIAEYDDFVQLDIEEEYSKLPYKTLVRVICFSFFLSELIWNSMIQKTLICGSFYSSLLYSLAFFKAAYALYDSEFYVKADDDIYLRPGNYLL